MTGETKPTILITGGSGTLGSALCIRLVDDGYRVRTLSRSEDKRDKLWRSTREEPYASNISILAGDVCDPKRLNIAFRGVDIVVHAAALKRIDMCERDPLEAKRVNVDGTENVIQAALEANVKRAIFISTDKACSPSTLYGSTKLNAERMWLASNAYRTPFMALRYGNVFGSAGSVLHAFKEQEAKGTLTITDEASTRFNITLKQAVQLVMDVMCFGKPGGLYIPKLPSYRLLDFVTAYMSERSIQGVSKSGLRPSEKLHESLISLDESESVSEDTERGYVLEPGKAASPGKRFCYTSESGPHMTVDQLRQLIRGYA